MGGGLVGKRNGLGMIGREISRIQLNQALEKLKKLRLLQVDSQVVSLSSKSNPFEHL